MPASEISALTNEQLLAALKTFVGDERRLMATTLEYLAEVDARSSTRSSDASRCSSFVSVDSG